MTRYLAAAAGLLVCLSLLSPAEAHHPFHEPVAHLAAYHYPKPNVEWGVYNPDNATNESWARLYAILILEGANGWQQIADPSDPNSKPVDFVQDDGGPDPVELEFIFRSSDNFLR